MTPSKITGEVFIVAGFTQFLHFHLHNNYYLGVPTEDYASPPTSSSILPNKAESIEPTGKASLWPCISYIHFNNRSASSPFSTFTPFSQAVSTTPIGESFEP